MDDTELERQIIKLCKALRKRPKNNRGPYVITDEQLDAILRKSP